MAEGRLPARPGIARIVDEALRGGVDPGRRVHLGRGVGTRGARACGRGGQRRSLYRVCRRIVPAKKPDPAIYTLALERLALSPREAIVIEDSRNGLLAAVGAGLRCVVTVSGYTADEDMSEAVLVVTSLGDPGEPATVLANRGAAEVGEMVTLVNLDACRSQPLLDKETV